MSGIEPRSGRAPMSFYINRHQILYQSRISSKLSLVVNIQDNNVWGNNKSFRLSHYWYQ